MPEERAQWGRQLEFILTLVGYAVGLGNVWRFPYLCYRNGGGAFLIPYIISLVFMGIPLFALECSFGQYGGKGPLSIWGINPVAKGIGFASVAVSFILMIYYSVIIAWGVRFLFTSFTSHLPWIDCKSCECLLYNKNRSALDPPMPEYLTNNTENLNCSNFNASTDPVSPSEIYFNDEVLDASGDITVTGNLQWQLVLCNLLCFIIVFGVLYKGIQSLGKVVYFTATFPYVLLTILLIRGAMLDGAGEGIKYYLEPDFERLSDASVWSDAAVQIFFSLSCCSGGLIAMASYNNFKNNVIRDSILVPIINCSTSFYAGFVVFSTLGYMAYVKGVSVGEVTAGGPGLAFVVYPEAIAQMPVSPLWAILFFIMLCILGFSSQFSTVETVITACLDEYPSMFRTRRRVIIFRMGVCVAGFLLGLPMVTQSGSYLLDLVDNALLGFPMLAVGLLEFIIIITMYGYNNFANDIACMIGRHPYLYFKWCWIVISPVLLVAVIIFKAFQFTPNRVDWANLLYWLIVCFVIGLFPVYLIYYVCMNVKVTQATNEWRDLRKRGEDMDRKMIISKENGTTEIDVEMTDRGGNKVLPCSDVEPSNGGVDNKGCSECYVKQKEGQLGSTTKL